MNVNVGGATRNVPPHRVEYWQQVDEYVRQRQAAEFERRCEALWQRSGVPPRHAEMADVREDGEGPWADTYHGLVAGLDAGSLTALLGRSGTGKTQMVVCVIRTATEQGMSALYVKAADLMDQLIESMHAGRHATGRDRFKGVGVLVIDEFHERLDSEFAQRSLKNIIDHRYDAGRSTLIVANQDRETFATSAGTSIVSRIHETGEAIVCDWPSFRRRSE